MESLTVALVTVLVLLVIEPHIEAVVVIELELVMGGVSVDPPVDIPPAVVLLSVVTVLLVAVVVVELVLATDSPNVGGRWWLCHPL